MKNKSDSLRQRIAGLSKAQLSLLDLIIDTFQQPLVWHRHDSSDVASESFMVAFGDMLKLHHTMSVDYLDKHRFEAVLERVFNAIGRKANRPNQNNPGHDITVDGVSWSLKTQGDKKIKSDILHISKFMELGKGKWEIESDLAGFRDRFLQHMLSYDRIFQLRYFKMSRATNSSKHFYELVEIPKSLLSKVTNGVFVMNAESRQNPKPGYCNVTEKGVLQFRLYFDGGTERKLQIKDLRKELCIVHGTWEF